MATRTKKKQGTHILPLEGELTIYNAAELKPSLIEALHKGQEMEIDVSKISEMDTAGLQLLLLTKREAVNQNKPLRLINHSDAVLELINLYNMAEYFGDPIILKHKSD